MKGNIKDHTGIICEPLIRSLIFPQEQVVFVQRMFPESLCSFSRMHILNIHASPDPQKSFLHKAYHLMLKVVNKIITT